MPHLTDQLDRLVAHHEAAHPELREVWRTFLELAAHLGTHMVKEELVLFPMIREFESARMRSTRPRRSLSAPIRALEQDHQWTLDALGRIRRLTGQFTATEGAPDEVCSLYEELSRFETDLLGHMREEDELLFQRVMRHEQELGPASEAGQEG